MKDLMESKDCRSSRNWNRCAMIRFASELGFVADRLRKPLPIDDKAEQRKRIFIAHPASADRYGGTRAG